MKITVTIDQPTGDFQDRLLALLAEHAATVELDATWTVERAESYYRCLPARARRIVREAVTRDGYVPADELRDDENSSLRGHSAALSRALRRGFRRGEWPENMQSPIEAQGPGFGKVVGYRMPDDLVQIFHTAIKKTDDSGPFDPRDINEAVDSFQALGDAINSPIPKKSATEK
ncbi:hypothetical protein AB0L71_28560 [Streptomyces sp. NPDC052052]|uniref:hypothetical protein n=1 Tax=Streptomyces sp. NPDC052052 TaxID=3154756 RepID=UPI0034399409